jgi:hypothetical protein
MVGALALTLTEMLSSDISQKQWCQNNGININSMVSGK